MDAFATKTSLNTNPKFQHYGTAHLNFERDARKAGKFFQEGSPKIVLISWELQSCHSTPVEAAQVTGENVNFLKIFRGHTQELIFQRADNETHRG